MNRRRWTRGVSFLLAALLFSSCASTTATTPAQLAALEASENGFLILDPGLADEITVLPRPFEPAGKGITVAVIDFRTTQRDSMELEARTFFKNEQGITIQLSPWKRFLVRLHPASTYSAPTLTPLPLRCMTQIRRATEASADPVPTVELDPKATLP